MTQLRTSRLVLRPAQVSDLEAFHAILSRPDATRYWSTPPHGDLAATRAWLDAMIDAPDGEGEDYVVVLDGRVIGKAGFYRLPEIGFILHPDVWGQGLAREAVSAVIDHVFATRTLDRMTADVDPRNLASLAVLERQGFVRVGGAQRTYLTAEGWADSLYLALDRETWRTRRGRT